MMLMAPLLLQSRHECRRSHRRRLAWIAAAACTTSTQTTTTTHAAAFLSMVPRRNHQIDPSMFTGGDWYDSTASSSSSSSCVGSLATSTRHTASLSLLSRFQPQQQQHSLRIRGRRWLTTKSLSNDDNAGAHEDSPSNRVKRKNKQQKIKEKSAAAAAIPVTPPPKSAKELAQDEENVEIENVVRNWVENIVIRLNLCPFAERPMRTNQLHIHIVRGNDEHDLLSSMLCALVLQSEQPGTTLVVCPECHADDFQEYLNVLSMMEAMLEDHDMTGLLQIAPFHPLFEFEGSSSSTSTSMDAKNDNNDKEILQNVDNYTNRAPYPIFHIIREDEVEHAVEMLQGDAGRVWKRNVRVLESMYQELGTKDFQQVMKPCTAVATSTSTSPTTATTSMTQQQQQNNMSSNESSCNHAVNHMADINKKVRDILRRNRVHLSKSSPSSSSDGYDDDDDDDDSKDDRS